MSARTVKTHGIKEYSTDRTQIFTWCGKDGYRCDGWSGEYDDPICNRFQAEPNTALVDCKTCLKAMNRGSE
ncbi:hypothetical protein ACQZ6A_06595 [Agrobacterium vitis]